MKTPKIISIKYQLGLVLMLLTQVAQAQDAPTFDDDVQDVPVAPIDNWIIPMMLVGLVFLCRFYKNNNNNIYYNNKINTEVH